MKLQRVICLYRVSTKKQVDKNENDIPMQRTACWDFASSKMKQMMLDGLYTGGPVKYGYSLTESGLVNRKGAPIKKYMVDPVESEIVHMIDDMTINKGYGSHRLA